MSRNSKPRNIAKETVRVETCEPQMGLEERLLGGAQIGKGGMSSIDEAFDTNLLRSVAKKTIKPEKEQNEASRGHLVEEAQITAQLDHPNIVPVHELGKDEDGTLFFTMKLVRGRTFTEILKEQMAPDQRDKTLFNHLQIFIKVCDAVAFAHSRGVIHRDLKPDNIMVGEFGEVYLMDWGLARLKQKQRPSEKDVEMPDIENRRRYEVPSGDGIVSATIFYMAPEQALGDIDVMDERTDVFCLGAILYEILTGQPPYSGDSVQKIVVAALGGRIVPPDEVTDSILPERLCGIAMKALSKAQENRYQSVSNLKQDAESFLQSGWQFERQVFEAGSTIVREGEPGDEAYIITKGRCQVWRTVDGQKSILEEISVGDVFGEVAVFSKKPRGATVEAIEKVTVMVITAKHFKEDLGMSFWLGLFSKALAERLLEADKRVVELEQKLEQAGLM